MTIESSVLIPSNIPQASVSEAKAYFNQGQYAQAWDALARGGDRYADNAAGVLGRNQDSADFFFQKLVEHWWDYTNPGAYSDKFNDVAHDHLNNYLGLLEKGYLPDTQFIIRSYEDAARDNEVDTSVALDGGWAKAVPGSTMFDATWGIPFLGMEPSRLTTNVSDNNLSPVEAAVLIGHAMTEAIYDVIKAGRIGEFVQDIVGRIGDGVGDYFGDLMNSINDLLGDTSDVISDTINDLFNAAAKYVQPVRRDPLTLDLDGDGLETVGTAAGILFDQTGRGVKTGTGWVKSDDGFLVLDRNDNGVIDNGRELFSDATIKSNGQLATDGFDALRDLDSNVNGNIDAGDAQFNNLKVWRDLNQDGITQSGELFTLNQLGIASINVSSTEHSQTLANGNQVADLGTFTRVDGRTGEVTGNLGDIHLAQDTFHRQFTTHPDTTAVANLPDMQAYPGRSRRSSSTMQDLHEAVDNNLWRMAA